MADPAAVRPLTDDEYAAFRRRSIAGYAEEMDDSGAVDTAMAEAESAQQFEELLPDGAATAGMRLLAVLDDARDPVGVLWIGPHPRRSDAGFVYDVEIEEARRGQGLGRRAMLAAEAVCREAGWSSVGLNVFGPNARARALYDSLGYAVVSTTMLKPLAPGG